MSVNPIEVVRNYKNNEDLKEKSDEELIQEEIVIRKQVNILLRRANRCVVERNLRATWAAHRENEEARKLTAKPGKVVNLEGPINVID